MIDLRKAAEMALDALEIYGAQAPAVNETIEALRQALAQHVDAVNMSQEYVDETTKGEQEPVAWVDITDEGKWSVRFAVSTSSFPDGTKFYTAPPKREWVDLDEEEQKECWDEGGSQWAIYQNIASKLKEKNT